MSTSIKLPPRRVRRIKNWREAALGMYKRMYGNRCVKCSDPVASKDAVLYSMEGIYDLILVHEKCEKRR